METAAERPPFLFGEQAAASRRRRFAARYSLPGVTLPSCGRPMTWYPESTKCTVPVTPAEGFAQLLSRLKHRGSHDGAI